jgi:hypothetical protein
MALMRLAASRAFPDHILRRVGLLDLAKDYQEVIEFVSLIGLVGH